MSWLKKWYQQILNKILRAINKATVKPSPCFFTLDNVICYLETKRGGIAAASRINQ